MTEPGRRLLTSGITNGLVRDPIHKIRRRADAAGSRPDRRHPGHRRQSCRRHRVRTGQLHRAAACALFRRHRTRRRQLTGDDRRGAQTASRAGFRDRGHFDLGQFDVILSNAALQWVPDHATLFPALIGKLKPGGTLAVQVPDNADEPAHGLIREIAADGPWASSFGAATRLHRNGALWYFGALRERATRLDIWRTTYFHVLQGGSN